MRVLRKDGDCLAVELNPAERTKGNISKGGKSKG